MIVIFFDIKGIVHKEFIPAGQTVPHTIVTFYGDCVKMCEDFTPNFGDNRTCCCITTTHNITLVPHPPYSSDLPPCDFSLLPQLKMKLKGHHVDTMDVIEAESQAALNTLTEYDFEDTFKKWQKRWRRLYTRSVQKVSNLGPKKQSSVSGWLQYLIPFKVRPL
jgi:hypothetical protein